MPLAFRNTPFRKSVLSSVDNASNMLNMQPYRPTPIYVEIKIEVGLGLIRDLER